MLGRVAEGAVLMTGAELASEIDDLLLRRPDLSKWRIGMLLQSSRHGVEYLRTVKRPRQGTIIKVRELIANPPSGAFKRPSVPPPRHKHSNNHKALAALRRSNRERAEDRMARGLGATGPGVPTCVRLAQLALERQQDEERRRKDPVEQALLVLRRQRRIIYRASVVGGPHDRFYISGNGRETISVSDVIKLARKHAA